MSSDRYDICIARTRKGGKTYWHRIGSAFVQDSGRIALNFDSLPVPEYSDDYGLQMRAVLFPAKDRAEKPAATRAPDLDDEVPF